MKTLAPPDWQARGFAHENEATIFAIDHLAAKGVRVHIPSTYALFEGWETPKELAHRLGRSPQQCYRRLQRQGCPAFEARRGHSGRIIRLLSNPALEAHLTHA